MTKSIKPQKTSTKNTPNQNAGVKITSKKVDIGGDVVGGNQIITNQGTHDQSRLPVDRNNAITVQSAWANGLFYLFAFVVIIGTVAWIAGNLKPIVLAIVVVTGVIVVPLIGALQLYMDKRLPAKSFLELMRLVVRQLPIISSLAKTR